MPVVNNQSLSGQETHPLLQRLWERIREWRSEIGSQTRPHLERLRDAMELAQASGIEPHLFVLVVAMCERWFRVYSPITTTIRRTLQRRLSTPRYTPYGMTGAVPLPTTGVLPIVGNYVNRRLKGMWKEDATDEENQYMQFTLKGKINELVRQFTQPFLVAEFRPLPPRRGGYPNWAPWVAATVIYQAVRTNSPHKQDSQPLDAAMALLEALLGTMPEKSHFHRKRREIEERAPQLAKHMLSDLRKALARYSDPPRRLKYLLEGGGLDSLEEWRGMKLLRNSS